MRFGDRTIEYAAADAEPMLAQGPPCEPLVILACHAGDFTQAQPCLAESLLFMPGGPVAVIAATTNSHPLPNYYTGLSMLRELGGQENRLGAWWLTAQRNAAKERNVLIDNVLAKVEGSLEEPIDLERIRHDQILMYNLLGDPATRLRLPEKLQATVECRDGQWHWTAMQTQEYLSLSAGLRPAKPSFPRA